MSEGVVPTIKRCLHLVAGPFAAIFLQEGAKASVQVGPFEVSVTFPSPAACRADLRKTYAEMKAREIPDAEFELEKSSLHVTWGKPGTIQLHHVCVGKVMQQTSYSVFINDPPPLTPGE